MALPSPEDDGSEEEAAVKESGKSGNAKHAPAAGAAKPKETPERGKKPSPPPPDDVGAKGSGEASPMRGAPSDELAAAAPPPRRRSKVKNTTKPVKRPPPPSQEERAQDEVEDSGDPSLASDAPAKEPTAASPGRGIVTAPDHNNRGASSPARERRAKRITTPPQDEKRAAAADHDGTGEPVAETGVPADKANHKKRKRKLRKVSAKLPLPESAESVGLTGNGEEVLDARNISSPQEKDIAQEGERQQQEMMEQEYADNTSPPQVNDDIYEEEQQGEEVADQENAEKTTLPKLKDGTHENEDPGVEVFGEALLERNTLTPKLCTSEGEKKPAVERSWFQDDEHKILTALVEHAQYHEGALPNSSDLLANLTFDKTDANADKLHEKIRKLKARYRRLSSLGCPTDGLARQLFELSHILWGKVDSDVRVEATIATRDFNQLSGLYPYLAKVVKVYAETHSSGDLIMASFTTIGDEKARHLDAMCKKQRVDAFNLDLSQAILTKEVLSALSSQIN